MLRRARFLIATVLLLGCGGGSAKPDGGPGTGGTNAGGGTTGTAGTSSTAGVTGAGGSATGGSGTAGAGMPTGTSLFTGQALLPAFAPACTNEIDATGDRWCAFIAASTTVAMSADLFVFNLTKAAAGTAITCGLTDQNCLLLTSMFGQDEAHAAGFNGDTLVYYDRTATPFGWRPGMTAGRALAVADPVTADVLLCTPDSKGTAIVCLRDLPMAMQTDPNLILSDILVGKLDDAATPPLVTLERVISFDQRDRLPRFQLGFPIPGGNTIAWSARATAATGPEILKMQTMGNDASRVTVATDVNDWTVSADGAHWYWRSMVGTAAPFPGTLQSAPYPSGAGPVTILANTTQYGFPTPTTMIAVDSGMRLLNIADPIGAPTASQSVDTGVLGFTAVSSKGHIVYVKRATTTAATMQTFTDLYVRKTDGTGACTLTTTTNALPSAVIFPPAAGGLIWVQRTITSVQEQYTRLSDCTLTSVAMNIAHLGAIGDRAVLYSDSYNSAIGTFSMWFRNLTGDTLTSDPASRIATQAGSFTVEKSGTTDLVVYSVNGGGNDDGVYLRSFGP